MRCYIHIYDLIFVLLYNFLVFHGHLEVHFVPNSLCSGDGVPKLNYKIVFFVII